MDSDFNHPSGRSLVYCMLTHGNVWWWWKKCVYIADTDENDIYSGSLLFDLATLRKATASFAEHNKLGHGGFGAVYKVYIPCCWCWYENTNEKSADMIWHYYLCMLGVFAWWTWNSCEKAWQDIRTRPWTAEKWVVICCQTPAQQSCKTSRCLHQGGEAARVWVPS